MAEVALSVSAHRVRGMEPTWERRELPVLCALVEHFDDVDAHRLKPGQIGQLAG